MINWIIYDRNSREIESHRDHLATDGLNVWILQHAKNINSSGYGWHEDGISIVLPITHWARINYPI
jgi:hypothetical protein